MAFIYAMSDMHGDMEAFERSLEVVELADPDNMLILCGDYMPPPDGDLTLIRKVMELQDEYPGQVIALMGNHELAFIENNRHKECAKDPAFIWMTKLPFYYETDDQIFVHAGVDEEAWDLWKVGTEDAAFCEMTPWQTGEFLKDVIAGHTGTWRIADDPSFHDVYWDGQSHYYIDGTVKDSHMVPVLKYDTSAKSYTAFTFEEDGTAREYKPQPPTALPSMMEDQDVELEDSTSSKPVNKKLWPFFILEVLRYHAIDGTERDDEGNRYLTRNQIVEFLEQDYGIVTQIKAVGDNLTRLHEASLDYPELGLTLEYLEGERNTPSSKSSGGKRQLLRRGWRMLSESSFNPSEIRVLIDAVIDFPAIPKTQARMLIANLRKLSPKKIALPDTTRFGHESAYNPDFFWNIEILNEAIHRHKRVSFVLGTYGTDRKLHRGRKKGGVSAHTVVPMQLLVSKGHYYLLAHYPGSDEVYKFRVDMMMDVKIDEKSSVKPPKQEVNVVKFRERHSYMMSGKEVKVVLRIDKERLHTLFDQFGPEVTFMNEREDTIDVELRSALYSVLFWSLQYYRSVEVISPPGLREVLANAGQTIHDMYSGEPGAISIDERQSSDDAIN